jgi:hypothetical protein
LYEPREFCKVTLRVSGFAQKALRATRWGLRTGQIALRATSFALGPAHCAIARFAILLSPYPDIVAHSATLIVSRSETLIPISLRIARLLSKNE